MTDADEWEGRVRPRRRAEVPHSDHLKPRLIPSSEDTRAPVQAIERKAGRMRTHVGIKCEFYVNRMSCALKWRPLAALLHCTCILQDVRQVFLLQTESLHLTLSLSLSVCPSVSSCPSAVPNCALLELLWRGGQETHRKRIMTGVTYMSARDRREISFLAEE